MQRENGAGVELDVQRGQFPTLDFSQVEKRRACGHRGTLHHNKLPPYETRCKRVQHGASGIWRRIREAGAAAGSCRLRCVMY